MGNEYADSILVGKRPLEGWKMRWESKAVYRPVLGKYVVSIRYG
jgi:hypothetical protein